METLSWQSSTWAGQPAMQEGSCSSWGNLPFSPVLMRIWEAAEPHSTARGSQDLWVHALITNIPTEPSCLAFPPPHTTWGLRSPHSSPVNSQAGTTLSGPCTAWHKRAPNLSCLTDWHHASRYSPRFPSSQRNGLVLKCNCHLPLEWGS